MESPLELRGLLVELIGIKSMTTFGGAFLGALRPDETRSDNAFVGRSVVPSMPRPVLNHAITSLQDSLCSVVQFQDYFAKNNNVEVY